MTNATVERRIREIIEPRVPQWNGDMDRWDASWLDSLEYIELVFEVSDKFGIDVPLDIEDVTSPRDLADYVEKELQRET